MEPTARMIDTPSESSDGATVPLRLPAGRSVVLVGMMGAGKTCIGRRLAPFLGLPFLDVDREIEDAAGCTIPEIFQRHGEAAFRDGERRVMARLLRSTPHILATGGGAFMDADTRALVRDHGISVWLRAEIDVLWRRVSRRQDRPLLRVADPRGRLMALMEERYPIYARADITVDSIDAAPEVITRHVLTALSRFVAARP